MNSPKPILSVLMPVYNGGVYLAPAIKSVVTQTFANFEFIIIDDGSTDDSLSLLKQYALQDRRIKLFSRENKGVVFTRNELLKHAQGKWLAWMDQDDLSHPDRLRLQLEQLENSQADICGSHWHIINHDDKLIDSRLMPLTKDSFVIYLISAVPFAHGSVMIRRKFIQTHDIKYGRYSYAEDYDLWTQFWNKGAVFANVNAFLYLYRDTATSFSKRTTQKNVTDVRKIRREFISRNAGYFQSAIFRLLASYDDLSQIERVYLITSSYLLRTIKGSGQFISVLKGSAKKSIGVALLYLLRGM